MSDRAAFLARAGRFGLSAAAVSALGLRLSEAPVAARTSLIRTRSAFAVAGGTTIKIGHINGFSGVYSAQALEADSGVELAIEEANGSNGRVTFVRVRGDDASTPLIGRYEAQRLIRDEKVDVLMGEVSSAVGLEVSNIAQESGVVYATHGFDTDLTGLQANRCTFRANVSSAMLARALVPSLMKEGRRWFFCVANYNYGIDAHKRLSAGLRGEGGVEAGSFLIPLGSREFGPMLRAAQRSHADVLVFCNLGSDTTYQVRAAVDAGLHRQMRFGGIVCDDESAIGMPAEELAGSQFGYVWGATSRSASSGEIYRKLKSRAHTFPPSWRQYLGYVTAQLLIERILATRSTAADALVPSLENHTYDAGKASPNLVRACDHQVVQDTYVATIQPRSRRRSPYEYLSISSVLNATEAGGVCDAAAAANFAKQTIAQRADYSPQRDF